MGFKALMCLRVNAKQRFTKLTVIRTIMKQYVKSTGEPCDLVLISHNHSWNTRIPNDKVHKQRDSTVPKLSISICTKKVTLKRKFFMWSGPHSKQRSNWGAPHRRLEHNST